jgi:hypothetical protein
MAGTTLRRRVGVRGGSAERAALAEHNKLVDDVETLRAAAFGIFGYQVENLAAGADVAARAVFCAPYALTVLDSVKFVNEAASAGIDGSNTAVITLRNITEGVDVATITLTANTTANAATALTLASANADVAANDVLGLVITQGATADLSAGTLQFAYQRQTVDAASDLTAAKIADGAGTVIT